MKTKELEKVNLAPTSLRFGCSNFFRFLALMFSEPKSASCYQV
ncbi:hypothetical protein JCM19240_4973 [Vibrio maritimus]|uniref:Uncharacterized protein n=1 Tax=Vibrio maritimus TaxID=990268 RepID=A0A090TJK7_9VIBR|nr:hypothetical protein JCM19240_4973 [Vibrio maritimus]